jgi:RHH-type transcriptional regulator, rel operon repressor / antitoxin RelB
LGGFLSVLSVPSVVKNGLREPPYLQLVFRYRRIKLRTMLAIRLDKKTEGRLARLSRRSGRPPAVHVREAILDHLDDLEDARLALARLARPARIYSAAEVKRALAL